MDEVMRGAEGCHRLFFDEDGGLEVEVEGATGGV